MKDTLFYCDVNDIKISNFISSLREYSEEKSKQVYVIKKALGTEDKYEYKYKDSAIVLVPKHKIIVLNYGNSENGEFENFFEDFVEDLSHLSDRFEYKKILNRPREWKGLIDKDNYDSSMLTDISGFLDQRKVHESDERKVDLLISLLIGSINDVDKVGGEEPETLLDKVKKKIILFDGMQSRFIYENVDEEIVTIQGLAGTGKTELLLHKLRETYVKNKSSKIAFTCFNKVLAQDMRNRIPRFFNFMKVDEQIEWNSRLWVFPSWGSQGDMTTGMYSYICTYYNLDFKRFSYSTTFDDVCKHALSQLEKLDYVDPCFDYIFIDESQDFDKSFFDLCKIVSKEKIYIAGDIFQNIFDKNNNTVNSTYLLNKCYRTDPKTLMFAHSVGMGLYEKPVVRWLEDKEWEDCGYEFRRNSGRFFLRRTPIRRFEDVNSMGTSSVQIKTSGISHFTEKILSCIDEIKENNRTVKAEDIAIVFLSTSKINYSIADELVYHIKERYNFESLRGYITKEKAKNQVFISNTNNIKGLEFPFIICVGTDVITNNIKQRNSIYMILTRSFLTSYFIINDINEEFINIYSKAAEEINRDGFMSLREPDQREKDAQAEKIRIATQVKRKSVEDMINEVFKAYPQLSAEDKNDIHSIIPKKVKELNEANIKARTKKMIEALLAED